jgi:hypothetical protein
MENIQSEGHSRLTKRILRTRFAPGTDAVAVVRSLARSHCQIGFISALGFVRFAGESTPVRPPVTPVVGWTLTSDITLARH